MSSLWLCLVANFCILEVRRFFLLPARRRPKSHPEYSPQKTAAAIETWPCVREVCGSRREPKRGLRCNQRPLGLIKCRQQSLLAWAQEEALGKPRPSVSPDQAWRDPPNGNGRFVKGQPASPRRS